MLKKAGQRSGEKQKISCHVHMEQKKEGLVVSDRILIMTFHLETLPDVFFS